MLNYSLDNHEKGYGLEWYEYFQGLVHSPYVSRHWQLGGDKKTPSEHRLGHRVIAAIQFIPILGALASLIERIVVFVHHLLFKSDKPTDKPKVETQTISKVEKKATEKIAKTDEKVQKAVAKTEKEYAPSYIDLSTKPTIETIGKVDLKQVIYLKYKDKFYGINKSNFESSEYFNTLLNESYKMEPQMVLEMSEVMEKSSYEKLTPELFKIILDSLDSNCGAISKWQMPKNEEELENLLFLANLLDCKPLYEELKEHININLLTVDFIKKLAEKGNSINQVVKQLMQKKIEFAKQAKKHLNTISSNLTEYLWFAKKSGGGWKNTVTGMILPETGRMDFYVSKICRDNGTLFELKFKGKYIFAVGTTNKSPTWSEYCELVSHERNPVGVVVYLPPEEELTKAIADQKADKVERRVTKFSSREPALFKDVPGATKESKFIIEAFEHWCKYFMKDFEDPRNRHCYAGEEPQREHFTECVHEAVRKGLLSENDQGLIAAYKR